MSSEGIVSRMKKALESIMPEGFVCRVALVGDSPMALSEEEQALTKFWAVHRQQEFAAGRMCARQALEILQIEAGDMLPDSEGLPAWPECSLGSITHSLGLALAIAGRAGAVRLLGVDVEKTNRMKEAARRRVVHPLEKVFAEEDQFKASILFSLKEAFYKAQYPHWRTAGNFHDIALSVDLEAGRAEVVQLDSRFDSELKHMQFAFRVVDDYVVSLSWL